MATTTALVLVNRLLRRHGYEDVSVLTEPEGLLGLDIVNQSIRDLLSVRDYPWNIRSDGVLRIWPQISATTGAGFADSDTVTITPISGSQTDYTGGTDAGVVVARLLLSGATTHNTTAMIVSTVIEFGGNLVVNLNAVLPMGSAVGAAYKFFFSEYLLPDTVAKVLSVRHQEQPIRLVEVPPHRSWDEAVPRPHDNEGPQPDVVMVGGTSVATCIFGTTPNKRLRLMVWPIPTTQTQLNYSYKERVTELAAATDTLTAPAEFFDDVVDRAEAISNMTQRFNDPALAQLQLRNSIATAERKWAGSTLDPNRRNSLRPHDAGSQRRDPTRYRDIGSL